MDLLKTEIGETAMTDYQTKLLFAALADTLNSSADIAEARARFNSITSGATTCAADFGHTESEAPMTDFQYKNLIEMIYQILKANFEAGKTSEEILEIISALKDDPKDNGQP